MSSPELPPPPTPADVLALLAAITPALLLVAVVGGIGWGLGEVIGNRSLDKAFEKLHI